MREREKEVQRTLATHMRDRDKEREQHKRDEAIQHFNALLSDLVRNADNGWREVKRLLRKDHRWDLADSLPRDEKEKLFNEHIETLLRKKREKFRELLDETLEVSLTSTWKEIKKIIREDSRYTKFASSERCEREFKDYLRDKLMAAKTQFKELLQETKLITHKSLSILRENQGHMQEIEEILKNDKRFLVLDHIPQERTQLVLNYLEELDRRGPPPPPTASEPSRRSLKNVSVACRLSTRRDITDPQVLILRPEGSNGNNAFFMPDEREFINIATGQVVDFNCGGANLRIDGANVGVGSINGTCNSGRFFTALDRTVDFSSISCDVFPPTVARFTGNRCLEGLAEFEIGYEANGRMIRLLRGCFDDFLQSTVYTLIELPPNIEGAQIGFPRPSWIEGDFFNLNGIPLNTIYTRNMQRITINTLLGLPVASTKYVQWDNSLFLARAHLAANADFIFGTQRRASFYFLNAAPKWHSFNEGNWLSLEMDIRRFVTSTRQTIQIYTGTFGISTLPHENTGEQIQLFLFVSGDGNRAIPVPQLFWKVIYEPNSRRGSVFLGVNNPYITLDEVEGQKICRDVSDQIPWLTWSAANITGGISYACTVDEFRAATGLLQHLDVVDLLKFTCLIFAIWYVPLANSAPRAGCSISINNDLTAPQVLVLRPEVGLYSNEAFFLPDDGDRITLAENQLVNLTCPGGRFRINGSPTLHQTGQVRCTSGKFYYATEAYPFSAFTCSVIPTRTVRATGKTCLSRFQEIETGFVLEDRFLRHLLICFDPFVQAVLYSEVNLTKTIAGYQRGFPRPGWLPGSGFFDTSGVSVNTLYTRPRQRLTINALLGLPPSSYKYIAQTSNFFLARGHLTAKVDFLYGSQHRLTFYFVNAAPQWQISNQLNWYAMEQNVRDFASRRELDLIVYTGTYGATSLPHEITNEQIELYLYVNGDRRGIPVPRLFWKLVYEPISKAGVVFVGVNNPYQLIPEKDIICTDICDEYDWLTWNPTNITRGYSYCCSVEDFRRTVATLPEIEVVKLLK
ncbi:hypothetical protein Trydic_g23667 [Trypoxylus dichotomus]